MSAVVLTGLTSMLLLVGSARAGSSCGGNVCSAIDRVLPQVSRIHLDHQQKIIADIDVPKNQCLEFHKLFITKLSPTESYVQPIMKVSKKNCLKESTYQARIDVPLTNRHAFIANEGGLVKYLKNPTQLTVRH